MDNRIWKMLVAIFEGVMMSLAARVASWGAMISVTAVWQMLGHTIGELALHVVDAMLAH